INATSPDPQIYGEFDDFLFWSMPRETERFFEEILTKDRSLLDFVHSDWTFLNQRLAQHYGIKDVFGGELRKVTLPAGSHRGGVRPGDVRRHRRLARLLPRHPGQPRRAG